jgi:hypothetical protein
MRSKPTITQRAGLYCAEAQDLITGERAKTHGSFIEQHAKAARMWTAYLQAKYGTAPELSAADVLKMLMDLKTSRALTGSAFSDDHGRDIVGYAALYAVALEQERK